MLGASKHNPEPQLSLMDEVRLFQRRHSWRVLVAGVSFFVLAVCLTLLVFDVLTEFFGFDISFYAEHHLMLEAIAVFALGVSLVIVGANFWRIMHENRDYRAVAGLASGEFLRVLQAKFDEWMLSSSEREIALLLIKGFSIQEIADYRDTKPGTIKSQSNAIYRKAALKGRNELVAYFIEDLMGGIDLTVGAEAVPQGS